MKIKRCIVALLLLGILYLQFGRAPYINVSTIKKHTDGYVLELTITTNKLFIIDKDLYAKSLIEKVLENDFKNMKFPYDELGHPKELRIKVYTNSISRLYDASSFEIHYNTYLDEIKIISREQSHLQRL